MEGGLIKYLSDNNDYNYNLTKALEELSELSEVLLQRINKGMKVPDKKITDEIGDLYIRLDILANLFGKGEVNNRIAYKLNKYSSYIDEGKFLNRI